MYYYYYWLKLFVRNMKKFFFIQDSLMNKEFKEKYLFEIFN